MGIQIRKRHDDIVKHLCMFMRFWFVSLILGAGVHPAVDPFGTEFSSSYMPQRHKRAGQRIAGDYVCVFDGLQADLEFVKKVFGLQRSFEAL